jgi:hypothetical protein
MAAKTRIGASKNTCEIDNKNRIKELYISSQTFHRTPGGRVQKITIKNDLNHESSGLLIRRLKSYTDYNDAHKTKNQIQRIDQETSSSPEQDNEPRTEDQELLGRALDMSCSSTNEITITRAKSGCTVFAGEPVMGPRNAGSK